LILFSVAEAVGEITRISSAMRGGCLGGASPRPRSILE
jgi:hypothetical protein